MNQLNRRDSSASYLMIFHQEMLWHPFWSSFGVNQGGLCKLAGSGGLPVRRLVAGPAAPLPVSCPACRTPIPVASSSPARPAPVSTASPQHRQGHYQRLTQCTPASSHCREKFITCPQEILLLLPDWSSCPRFFLVITRLEQTDEVRNRSPNVHIRNLKW